MGPHQPAAVVVDHDGQVLVAALVGDLIDPDPRRPANASIPAAVSAHTRVMIDPTVRQAIRINSVIALLEHWVANQATCCIERAGVSRAVSGPRAPGAPSARGRGSSPAARRPPGRPGWFPDRAPATAAAPRHGHTRTPSLRSVPQRPRPRSSRPHVGHQNLRHLIELDILDHGVLDAQHRAPYTGVLHAVLRSVVFDLRQARNLDRECQAGSPPTDTPSRTTETGQVAVARRRIDRPPPGRAARMKAATPSSIAPLS